MRTMVPLIGLLMVLAGITRADETLTPSIDTVFPSQKRQKIAIAPIVRESTEYYEIRGDREYDLQCELRAKGCEWIDGKIYDSMTTWEFAWDYDYVRTPSSCSIQDFRITVDIVVRYPRWLKNDLSPQVLVEKWDSYMSALVHHETGHRDLALLAANEIIRDVNAIAPASNCADLDTLIEGLSSRRIQQLRENTEAYDAGTLHGSTQGAVLD